MMKEIKITFNNLVDYVNYIQEYPNTSLNEYIQERGNYNSPIVADLSEIKFDNEHKLNLTGANLTGTILDGVEFSGKYVIIKGADLKCASKKNTKFTDYIDLAGTKIGPVSLSREVFVSCKLKNADYDPNEDASVVIKASDKQIVDFLNNDEKISLNDYLSKYYYPNYKVIADLGGCIINRYFSNKDLSGSNLKDAVITGEIINLELRDCLTNRTIFKDCTLLSPDLRGTCLADSSPWAIKNIEIMGSKLSYPSPEEQGFQAAIFKGEVKFGSPKLSLGSKDPKLLLGKDVLPLEDNDNYTLFFKGNIELDPCYKRGSNDPEIKINISFSVEDVKAYVQRQEYSLLDFNSYMCKRYPSLIKNYLNGFVADLSGLDFSAIDFSKSKYNQDFQNCNFAFTKFREVRFATQFKNCNLVGVSFSSASSSLKDCVFEDCDLSSSIMHDVDASDVIFKNVIGINLQGKGLNITHAQAKGINLKGAFCPDLKAEDLQAEDSNWDYAYLRYADFKQADLHRAKFKQADLIGASLQQTKLSSADLFKTKLISADFKETDLTRSRMAADMEYAQMIGTILDDADISSLSGVAQWERVDFSLVLASAEQKIYAKYQIDQEIKRNKDAIYSKYPLRIAIAAVVIPLVIAVAVAALPYAVVAGAIISMVAPVVATISCLTIVAIAVDKVKDSLPILSSLKWPEPTMTERMANLFGAKTIEERANKELRLKAEVIDNEYQNIVQNIKLMSKIERDIDSQTKERFNNTTLEYNNQKKFTDKHAPRANKNIDKFEMSTASKKDNDSNSMGIRSRSPSYIEEVKEERVGAKDLHKSI